MKEIEIISKRGAKEKHFLREDGTFVARVYNDDIHYKKDGKYEEIDNSLVKRNGYYKNKKNDYQVSYKENTKDSFLRMEKEGYFLEMKLKEANEVKAKKVKRKPEISYPNIFEGIDIEYQTLPTKVKETIILKNQEASRKDLSFLVNTNLTLSLDNNKILAKEKNEVIFTVDAPYMEDSNGNLNYDIFYSLEEKEDGYEIKLQLDHEWLTFGDIKYPVRIDPTITNQSQGGSVYDTYIYPGDTGVTRHNEPVLKAGVEKVNGQNRTNRTLIKFDLPKIGTGSEVIDATLSLTCYPLSYNTKYVDNKVLTVHRIKTDWNEETANWDNMNNNYLKRVESTILASRSVSAGNTIMSLQYATAYLTNLIKKWYTGTPNYGIMIKSAEEVYLDEGYPAFFSKSANIEGIDVKPLLEITYRNQNGLESYLNYKNQSFTHGTTYVNTFNGNLTGIWNLGQTIGGKLPASVGLVYNTNDVVLNQNTIYGKGYKLTLDQTIKEIVIDDYNYLEFIDEDGTTHYFYEIKKEDETLYQDEDGLSLTIQKEDNQYKMTDKNGNQMIFVKNGDIAYLQKQKDVRGNIIQIERNTSNQITKVIDANNAEINIYYQPNKIRIASPDRTMELNYLNGDLVEIKDDQGISHITYNMNHLITEITDVTGLKLNYSYYSQSPYKVQKITQYGLNNELGNYFTLEYGFETTTITDHNGRTNTLIFNPLGNLLSSNSMKEGENLNQAYSTISDYGDEFYQKNKLLANTVPVRYVKNFINNSSFETEEAFIDGTYYNLEKSHSTECSVSGYQSLKLKINLKGQQVESRKFVLPQNKYYTFSGYFKNEQKMKLSIVRYDEKKEFIQNSIEIEPSNEFLRHDITFYHENSYYDWVWIEMTFEEEGTTYIDDIQLEEGEVANDYSIIGNSDFSEGLNGWDLTANRRDYTHLDEVGLPTEKSVPIENVFKVVKVNNNQNTALEIKMNPLERSSIEKKFPIKGKKGDIYTVSFWYKNEGIQSDGNMAVNNVAIYFKPVGEEADYCILPSKEFNPNENQWQYFTFRYDADKDYEEIRLIFHQGGNANSLYITNLSFYKDVASSFYDYDENGNITGMKESSKDESNTFGYDSNNQLISATTPKGKNFKYEYDNTKTDQVLSAISSMGISNQAEYDSFGNPVLTRISKKSNEELTDGLYLIRAKGTDKYLNFKSENLSMKNDFCSNATWKLEKRKEEKITIEVSEEGEEHQIIEKIEKIKLFHSVLSNFSIGYLNNELFLTENNQNNEFVLKENENGSYSLKVGEEYVKVNESSLEITSIIENDPAFEFYFEIPDEEFIETTATYTGDGRFVTSVTDSNFNKTEYDTDEVTGLTKSMTNANNQTTNYTYNDKKQITLVTQGEKTVNYTYNDKNLLEKIVQGNKEYKFTYDNFLNTKAVNIGNDITLVTNEYGPNNGNIIKTTYGNGQEIGFEYDEFDRSTIIHKMDKDYHYKYDSNGNVAKILEFDPITTYDTYPQEVEKAYASMTKCTYDTAKRIEEYQKDDFRIRYAYDKNDNVTGKKYKLNENHSLENTFNKDDQLTQTKLDNQKVNYEYDSLGRLKRKEINDNYQTEYEYVRKGKRTSNLVKSIKNGNNQYSYQYDKLNNITHIFYNNRLLNLYEYDNYNELIKEENYQRNEKIEYIYDNSGNLLEKTTKNLETDDIIRTDTYQYQNSDWEDQLTKFNGQEITYDAIGNPLSIGNSITMEWVNGRSLKSYKDTTKNQEINYKYNKDGIREEKNINGEITKYYLENNNIIYEQRGNNTIYYLYDLTGLVGLKYQDNTYYYIKNLQGDIIGILDQDYHQVVTYEYDSWGKLLSIKDENQNEITEETNIGIINPFRYRGYYYDTETGLYYLNSRYYNPIRGRFINADSSLGMNGDHISYNLYVYVSNNPINNSDSSGQFLKKAWNWLKKKTGQVGKAVSNMFNQATKALNGALNQISKMINAIKSAFVFETEVGFGAGGGLDVGTGVGTVGFNASISKTMGYSYSNNQSYQYTSTNIGVDVALNDYKAGLSLDVRNYDNGMENPMAMPWQVWDDENTVKDITILFHRKIIVNNNLEAGTDVSKDSKFIGISFEGFCVVGGKIKIGFNI